MEFTQEQMQAVLRSYCFSGGQAHDPDSVVWVTRSRGQDWQSDKGRDICNCTRSGTADDRDYTSTVLSV